MTIAFPTNDNLACVYVAWPKQEFRAFRSDVEGNYLKTVELVPELAELVRAGEREERFAGTAVLPNFFCKPYGPGWALVGDAGYHKDPVTAQGITEAFRDAELLPRLSTRAFRYDGRSRKRSMSTNGSATRRPCPCSTIPAGAQPLHCPRLRCGTYLPPSAETRRRLITSWAPFRARCRSGSSSRRRTSSGS